MVGTQLYYDPYDREIDRDPYPVYRRLRDEAPLYHNERLDFWAMSRFADVLAALHDTGTYTSTRGVALEDDGQGAAKSLYVNQWNAVKSGIGSVAAGKTVDRILVAYDSAKGPAKSSS